MSVRGLVTVVVGIVAFAVINILIASVITGTDSGSVLLINILRILIAAAILIGIVMAGKHAPKTLNFSLLDKL